MENVMKLISLETCDICNVETYICSFDEPYYKCEFDSADQIAGYYNDLNFMKIPNSWGKKIILE